ncbi:calcium/proton exchanger [Methanosarcina sp.]|uniref:calcium/proton exchanger n=1 Tax=Methanosarcina sp. TaxID=2213 RepID=UPI002B54596D|nr:calcium/proton exchanger [Methanosarcina sp.]HOW16041.1 calcium/proton exchanger [Methanosarcina sp.]
MKKTDKMENVFLALLIFVPLSLFAEYMHFSPMLIFILASLAIIPLAKFIGESTEEISVHTGPALGGLLNATFGNATELIISVFALQAGLTEMVKASITGSIIGNLLLILGMAFFFGGLGKDEQTFNTTAARTSASTLFLATAAIVMPAVFVLTSENPSVMVIETLSIAVSVIMAVSYLASLLFSLRTHRHLYTADTTECSARWSVKKSVTILLASTVAVAVMSEILVGSIEPLAESLGWTELFIGMIFVAIIGNAAEHVSAITIAVKNRMDLSLQIAIGSTTQIAMFVVPVLVFTSYFFETPMNLIFTTFELACIVSSVLIVKSIIEDGKSNWFEGLQLLGAYGIMIVVSFLHP